MSPFLLPLPAGGALEPRPGVVLAVCGENGSGLEAIRDGVADRVITADRRDPDRLAVIGSRRALAPQLDLADNVYLGHELTRRWGVLRAGIDRKRTREEATRLLASLGCTVPPFTAAGDLGESDRILVELARALATGAELIVLEEPTAHLNEVEAESLHERLRELAVRGIAVVVLTQKPREAIGYADVIAVLRAGGLVQEYLVEGGAPDALREAVLRAMVDRGVLVDSPVDAASLRAGRAAPELLAIRGWSVPDPVEPERRLVDDVDLVVHEGEIVGIAGLRRSGADALLLSVYGRSAGASAEGSVALRGTEIDTSTVGSAIASGLFLAATEVPHYRVRFVGGVSMPVSAAALPTLVSLGLVDRDSERSAPGGVVTQAFGALRGPGTDIGAIVSAFASAEGREVLFLLDPTRGLDVERSEALHADLRSIAARGGGVVLVSTDLAELATRCDRVVGMANGRVTGEWSGGDVVGLAELIAPD